LFFYNKHYFISETLFHFSSRKLIITEYKDQIQIVVPETKGAEQSELQRSDLSNKVDE
jgi:hypothetical protein